MFSDDEGESSVRLDENLRNDLACAASFKYKKFSDFDEALKWYKEHHSMMHDSKESLMKFSVEASEPFQFLSKELCIDSVYDYNRLPVSQDASASAYQIMSYLLLNEKIGMRTNLLPSSDGQIQDLYKCLLEELKEFLLKRLDRNKYTIIESKLTRKLVKVLFMPLIYGKTLLSMANDISQVVGSVLSSKDCYGIGVLCQSFWMNKYPDIVNLWIS